MTGTPNYFDLADQMTPRRWHVGKIVAPDGSEPDFLDARVYEGPEPVTADIHAPGRVLEFCRTSFGVPIASRRLANVIERVARASVQLIDIELGGQQGMVVLNALRTVKCLDEERSLFTKWRPEDGRPDRLGGYRQVVDLTVDPRLIPKELHFFRLAGFQVVLVVSQELKRAMEDAGCDGARFTPVG